MTVVDASLYADALLLAGPDGDAARTVVEREPELHVPEIFPAEVLSAIRGLHLAGHVPQARARRGLDQLASVRLERYPIEPFIERIWQLRHNVTVYDAAYITLAERLETALVTSDRRLTRAEGPYCPVIHPTDA